MDVSERFVLVSALICEPARARMLWGLLDGRAYTATELSTFANISITSSSNHLARLLEADIVKVEIRGRYRYYSFASPEVAYAMEALAQLATVNSTLQLAETSVPVGIRYCRTCYDHLAGFVGVKIVEAMEREGILKSSKNGYLVTRKGWNWLGQFGIFEDIYASRRRPLTRQCLDWSERRPHLAGQLGADLMQRMFERKWFRKVQNSRELVVTAKGRQGIYDLLRVSIP